MKCHTCKFCFNTAYYGPPCREIDWENSDPKEYDFGKCLFYKEDKFQVFIQNLETNQTE